MQVMKFVVDFAYQKFPASVARSCAVIGCSKSPVPFQREKERSCETQARSDERNRDIHRTPVVAEYVKAKQPFN